MRALKLRWPGTTGLAVLVAVLFGCVAALPASAADQAKPKRRDTNARLKPPEVKFTTAVEPARAKPGDTVTYKVTATVDAPWHIYAYAPEQPKEGPRNTQFDFFDPAGLTPGKTWSSDQPPLVKKEPAFPELDAVAFHETEVTWTLPVQIPAGATPGKHVLRNQIYFQICNDRACKPPVYSTLPDATVTVIAGGGSGGMAALSPTDRAAIVGGLLIGAVTETPAAVAAAPAKPTTVQGAIDQGFLSFFLFSALGGVAALLMPCVWPMVPITVNFFVKQGQTSKKGSTTGLAITYCLSIIVIFTLVGVLCSVFMGAASLTKLGSNPWLNAVVALVFLAFGLSLLGLFEIRLPSFLLNASAKGESRGGVVGVIFMALTLTITSFTCTFPVVGGLLVMAAKGQYFYPIVGMMTFATVLALPFFVLALAPGQLAKLPRSGDWMNTVKIVGGLVEIGAAFKFLNTAEIGFGATPANAWFDAQVVLAAWVVLSMICGLYLLGLFRTDHDHDQIQVGPIRLLSGAAFLFLALYLAPALFGYPPRGRIYDRLIVGILPQDSDELDASRQLIAALPQVAPATATGESVAIAAETLRPVKATSTDPEVAIREEKTVHGVLWGLSYDAAMEEAKAKNRPVLIDFTGVNCANCRLMERSVFPLPDVIDLMKKFVTVQLYTDIVPIDSISKDDREVLAEDNLLREQDLVQQTTSPYYVALTPEGKLIASTGFAEPRAFVEFLKNALETHEAGGEKVAQAQVTAPGR